jgi:hypothetical protein
MKKVVRESTVRGFISKHDWPSLESLADDMMIDAKRTAWDEDQDGEGEDRLQDVERVEIQVNFSITKLPR